MAKGRTKNPIPTEKYCPRCKEILPIDKFGPCKSRSTGIQYYCRPCLYSYKQENAHKNKDRLHEQKRKLYYGMEYGTYDKMVKEQSGKCLICAKEKKLVVDHDHETGNVRGLLCNLCNLGLGAFKDSPSYLTSAIKYLGTVYHSTT